jgi:cell division septal protein FtsQ
MTRDLKDIGPSEFSVTKNGTKTQKNGERRRPATLILALCALAVLGLVLAGAVRILPGIGKKIGDSSYFRLEGVDVIGVERADRNEIGRAIGFAAGSPLLETDLVAIRERVEKIDWVKDALVKRDLPNKLVITIVEHTPVAATMTDDGLRFVDPDGGQARINAGIGDLPIFVGMTSKAEYAEGARLLEQLTAGGIVADGRVQTMRYDRVMGYTVITRGGVEIRFGLPPFDEKIRRLAEVLQDAEKRGPVRYVYLNIEDRVIVKIGEPVM